MNRLLLALCLVCTGCAQHSAALHPATPVAAAMDRQIRNATDAGNGDYLLRSLRQRVIENPEDLEARLALGHAYELRNDPELALEHYRLAAERFPDSGEAHLQLARSLAAAQLPAEAAAGFGAFLAAHPVRSAAYWSWLGILRDRAGDWRAGETAHRQAIEIATSEGQDRDYLHNNLGYCLLKQGHKEQAAAEFRAALSLNHGSEVALDNLGIALAADPKAAIVKWQAASEPAAAHSNMAAILIEQHKYAEARGEIARALGYNRTHPAALANLKLVSELDGKPAIIPALPERKRRFTAWSRAIREWMGRSPKSSNDNNAQTASR